MSVGPGLAQWCQTHQATPLPSPATASEAYPWPDVKMSVLPILIGNSMGDVVRTIVGYDLTNSAILEPGPGTVVQPFTLTLMYDSTNAADIPGTARVVAGYTDGMYAWSSADWALHPNAKDITISVFGAQITDAYDAEPGDLTPGQAASAIQNSPASMGYGTLATIAAIRLALNNAGNGSPLRAWSAHWNGIEHICNHDCWASLGLTDDQFANVVFLATQFASPETGSGGHFDVSAVTPDFMNDF